MKKKVIAFGEIIWDVYPDKKTIGGAALNFSAHAAHCGMQSALLSAVGDDELGHEAISALRNFGVDTRHVQTVPEATGQCLVTLDENFTPSYAVLNHVAYDNIRLTQAHFACINAQHYDALYFGTLSQLEPVSRAALRALVEACGFETIVCDVNIRTGCYDKESVEFCLSHASILKVSAEEEPVLRGLGLYEHQSNDPGSIAKAICRKFSQLEVLIITLGKLGSYAYTTRSGKEYFQPSIGDNMVSTVGAGDSFLAAWVTEYLNGKPIDACMKKAAEISGFVVSKTEAVPLYP